MEIIKRTTAKELGLTRYFTGKPCNRGHICERNTRDKGCIECHNISMIKWRQKNPDKVEETAKNWRKKYYLDNKEVIKARTKEWNKNNSEYAKKRCAEYRLKNEIKLKESRKQNYKNNPYPARFLAKLHKLKKKQAVPKWANLDKIKEIYKNCPEGYQVDHVIPLQGKIVCGLHVDNNLQYLTPLENMSKSNKFEIIYEKINGGNSDDAGDISIFVCRRV